MSSFGDLKNATLARAAERTAKAASARVAELKESNKHNYRFSLESFTVYFDQLNTEVPLGKWVENTYNEIKEIKPTLSKGVLRGLSLRDKYVTAPREPIIFSNLLRELQNEIKPLIDAELPENSPPKLKELIADFEKLNNAITKKLQPVHTYIPMMDNRDSDDKYEGDSKAESVSSVGAGVSSGATFSLGAPAGKQKPVLFSTDLPSAPEGPTEQSVIDTLKKTLQIGTLDQLVKFMQDCQPREMSLHLQALKSFASKYPDRNKTLLELISNENGLIKFLNAAKNYPSNLFQAYLKKQAKSHPGLDRAINELMTESAASVSDATEVKVASTSSSTKPPGAGSATSGAGAWVHSLVTAPVASPAISAPSKNNPKADGTVSADKRLLLQRKFNHTFSNGHQTELTLACFIRYEFNVLWDNLRGYHKTQSEQNFIDIARSVLNLFEDVNRAFDDFDGPCDVPFKILTESLETIISFIINSPQLQQLINAKQLSPEQRNIVQSIVATLKFKIETEQKILAGAVKNPIGDIEYKGDSKADFAGDIVESRLTPLAISYSSILKYFQAILVCAWRIQCKLLQLSKTSELNVFFEFTQNVKRVFGGLDREKFEDMNVLPWTKAAILEKNIEPLRFLRLDDYIHPRAELKEDKLLMERHLKNLHQLCAATKRKFSDKVPAKPVAPIAAPVSKAHNLNLTLPERKKEVTGTKPKEPAKNLLATENKSQNTLVEIGYHIVINNKPFIGTLDFDPKGISTTKDFVDGIKKSIIDRFNKLQGAEEKYRFDIPPEKLQLLQHNAPLDTATLDIHAPNLRIKNKPVYFFPSFEAKMDYQSYHAKDILMPLDTNLRPLDTKRQDDSPKHDDSLAERKAIPADEFKIFEQIIPYILKGVPPQESDGLDKAKTEVKGDAKGEGKDKVVFDKPSAESIIKLLEHEKIKELILQDPQKSDSYVRQLFSCVIKAAGKPDKKFRKVLDYLASNPQYYSILDYEMWWQLAKELYPELRWEKSHQQAALRQLVSDFPQLTFPAYGERILGLPRTRLRYGEILRNTTIVARCIGIVLEYEFAPDVETFPMTQRFLNPDHRISFSQPNYFPTIHLCHDKSRKFFAEIEFRREEATNFHIELEKILASKNNPRHRVYPAYNGKITLNTVEIIKAGLELAIKKGFVLLPEDQKFISNYINSIGLPIVDLYQKALHHRPASFFLGHDFPCVIFPTLGKDYLGLHFVNSSVLFGVQRLARLNIITLLNDPEIREFSSISDATLKKLGEADIYILQIRNSGEEQAREIIVFKTPRGMRAGAELILQLYDLKEEPNRELLCHMVATLAGDPKYVTAADDALIETKDYEQRVKALSGYFSSLGNKTHRDSARRILDCASTLVFKSKKMLDQIVEHEVRQIHDAGKKIKPGKDFDKAITRFRNG